MSVSGYSNTLFHLFRREDMLADDWGNSPALCGERQHNAYGGYFTTSKGGKLNAFLIEGGLHGICPTCAKLFVESFNPLDLLNLVEL